MNVYNRCFVNLRIGGLCNNLYMQVRYSRQNWIYYLLESAIKRFLFLVHADQFSFNADIYGHKHKGGYHRQTERPMDGHPFEETPDDYDNPYFLI